MSSKFELPKLRVVLSTCMASALAWNLGAVPVSGQEPPLVKPRAAGKEWKVVDGWAVIGYVRDKGIGYDWYVKKDEADQCVGKMKALTGPSGERFYDRVEVVPEQHKIPLWELEHKEPAPESLPKEHPGTPPWVDEPAARRPAKEPGPQWVGGKTGRGKVAGANLIFDFASDGMLTAVDPYMDDNSLAIGDSDKTIAVGEWSQTGDHVAIRTENFLYGGIRVGHSIKGQRIEKGIGNRVQAWEIAFAPPEDRLIQTWYCTKNGIVVSTLTFQRDGKAIWRDGRGTGERTVFWWEWENVSAGRFLMRKAPTNYWDCEAFQVLDDDPNDAHILQAQYGRVCWHSRPDPATLKN